MFHIEAALLHKFHALIRLYLCFNIEIIFKDAQNNRVNSKEIE